MRLPPFAALLVAGVYAIVVLVILCRAAVRSPPAVGLIALALAIAFGWLMWFTYQ